IDEVKDKTRSPPPAGANQVCTVLQPVIRKLKPAGKQYIVCSLILSMADCFMIWPSQRERCSAWIWRWTSTPNSRGVITYQSCPSILPSLLIRQSCRKKNVIWEE